MKYLKQVKYVMYIVASKISGAQVNTAVVRLDPA
jgi:hypothetical protein